MHASLFVSDQSTVYVKRQITGCKFELDFQVENQPLAAYIGRTALVPICQCPSQEMSQLKIFCKGGGVTWTMSKLDNVQVGQCLSWIMSKLKIFFAGRG